MIIRLPANVARCITLLLCVGPVARIMAQTSSPAPFAAAPPTDTPTISTANITASPTAVVPISTSAPTTASSDPTTDAPTTAAPVIAPITTLAPVSASPTAAATLAPVSASPTLSPIQAATNSPTTATPVATDAPTTSSPVTITLAPVVATGTPTNQPVSVTAAPTTQNITISPTNSPTIATTTAPSGSPSATPTLKPTSASPTASPSLPALVPATNAPSTSASPTQKTTTQSPTKKVSQPPTSYIQPTTVNGLKVKLTGICSISDPSEWNSVTSNFYATQYEDSNQMSNIKVTINLDSEKSNCNNNRAMMMRGRGLQSTDSVEVTYNQGITYSTTNASLTLDDVLQMPLMTPTQQADYVAELKELVGYDGLTAVSSISLPSDDRNDDSVDPNPETPESSFPLWAIIVIAVVGVALLVCIVPFVLRKCRRSNSGSELQPDLAQDNSRQFNAGEETVGTTDYDYTKAYGGNSNFSLSDAGGTLGDRTGQSAGDLMHQSGNNTIFSEDPTYNEAYAGSGREEMIDVYAPAGKLGVVIDTPNDGAPIVHAVKDSSPIADKIRVGDKLVAVDDQDVRTMTAIQVSKLISKKSVNASRKMTVIRNV